MEGILLRRKFEAFLQLLDEIHVGMLKPSCADAHLLDFVSKAVHTLNHEKHFKWYKDMNY